MLDEPFEDEGFETEPPTDVARAEDTIPPEAPSTSPELGFYICPVCHGEARGCRMCNDDGIIDREAMDIFKKKLEKEKKT